MPEQGYTFQISADAGQAIRVLDETGKAILTLSNQAGKGGAGLDGLAMDADQLADKLLGAGKAGQSSGRKLQDTGEEASSAGKKLQMMFHSVELLKSAFGALSSVASGIGSIFGSMRGSIDETANSFRQATLYGIDPKWLSEMTAVAKAAGREMDDVLDVVRDVRERIGEAVREMDAGNMANTFVVAFKELGATEKDLRHWQHNTVEAVEFVMKAMGEAGGASATLQMTLQEIASAGTEKFGPIMAALGEHGLAGALDTVRAMGLTSSVALGKMAEKVSFQMGLIGQLGEGIEKSFMTGLMPVLLEMTTIAIGFIDQFGPKSNEGIQEFARKLSGSILSITQTAIDSLRGALALINEKGIWTAFTDTAQSTWDTFKLYATAAIYSVAATMVEVLSTAMASSMSWLSDFLFFDEAGSKAASAGFAAQGEDLYGQATGASFIGPPEAAMGQGSLTDIIAGLDVLSGKVTEARANVEKYTVATDAATEATDGNTQATGQNSEARQFSAQMIAELEHAHTQELKSSEDSLVVLRAERDALLGAAAAGLTQVEALKAVELATLQATAAQKVFNGLSQESADAWLAQRLEAVDLREEIAKLSAGLEASSAAVTTLNAGVGGTSAAVTTLNASVGETLNLGDSLQQGFSASFDAIINGTRDLKDIWKGVGLSMAKDLTNTFLSGMQGPGGFAAIFTDTFGGLGGWLSNMFQDVFGNLGGWLKDSLSGIGGWLSDLFDGVGGWFSDLFDGGGGGGDGFMSSVGGWFSDLFSGGDGFLSNLGDGIMDMFSGDGGFLSGLGDWFMGDDGILSSIGDGVASFAGDALGTLSDWGGQALDYLAKTGSELLYNFGTGMLQGIPALFSMFLPSDVQGVVAPVQAGVSALGAAPGFTAGTINMFGGQAMTTPSGNLIYMGTDGTATMIPSGSYVSGTLGLMSAATMGAGIGAGLGRAVYGSEEAVYGGMAGGTIGATGAFIGLGGMSGGFGAIGAGAGAGAQGSMAALAVGIGTVAVFAVVIGLVVAAVLDATEHFEHFGTVVADMTHEVMGQIDAYAAFGEKYGFSGRLGMDLLRAPGEDPLPGIGESGLRDTLEGYGLLTSAAVFMTQAGEYGTREYGYNWDERYGSTKGKSGDSLEAAWVMAMQFADNLEVVIAKLIESGMSLDQAQAEAQALMSAHMTEWGINLGSALTLLDPILFQAQNRVMGRGANMWRQAGGGISVLDEAKDDIRSTLEFITDSFGDQMPVGLNAEMIYQAGLVPYGAPVRYDWGSQMASSTYGGGGGGGGPSVGGYDESGQYTGDYFGQYGGGGGHGFRGGGGFGPGGPSASSGGTPGLPVYLHSGGTGGLGTNLNIPPEIIWLINSGDTDALNAWIADPANREAMRGTDAEMGMGGHPVGFIPDAPADTTWDDAKRLKEISDSDEEFDKLLEESILQWQKFDAERSARFVADWGASATIIQEGFSGIWQSEDTYEGIDQFIEQNMAQTLGNAFAGMQQQIIDDLFNDTMLAGAMMPVTTMLREMADVEIDWADPESAAMWSADIRAAFADANANMHEMAPAIQKAKDEIEQLSLLFMDANAVNAAMIAKYGEEAVQDFYLMLLVPEAIAKHGVAGVRLYLDAWADAERQAMDANQRMWLGVVDLATASAQRLANIMGDISSSMFDLIRAGGEFTADSIDLALEAIRENIGNGIAKGIIDGLLKASGVAAQIENLMNYIVIFSVDGFSDWEKFFLEKLFHDIEHGLDRFGILMEDSGIGEWLNDLFPTTGGRGGGGGGGAGSWDEVSLGLGLGVTGTGGDLGLAVSTWVPSTTEILDNRNWAQRSMAILEDFTDALKEQPSQITITIDGEVLVDAVTKNDRIATRANRSA